MDASVYFHAVIAELSSFIYQIVYKPIIIC